MIKVRVLIALLSFTFIGENLHAANFRDGSLSLLYGDNYKVEPEEQTTVTFEYAAAWDWVDMFLFIDAKDFDNGDSRYGEFSPRIKIMDFDGDGLLRKLTFATTFERGSGGVESNLYGLGFDFNTSFFHFFNANLYQRDDPDIPGKGYQLTGVWSMDTKLGSVPLIIDGFFDWTFSSDEVEENLHFNPQIKIDMQQWHGGNHKWYLGIEYDYWSDKFGIADSSAFETNQNTFSILAKWHF